MHGYLIKRKDGTMTEYVSWRDKRGNIDDERISGVDFSKNGTSLKRNLPAVSLCSFNEDFFGAEFFTLGSYISYYFAGVNITHKTDACASGFFDADGCGGAIHMTEEKVGANAGRPIFPILQINPN